MHSQAVTAFGKPLADIESPTPEPRGTEVVVKVHHCGVCHSDVHLHDGHFDMGEGKQLDLSRTLKLPHTLGHEIEGEVVALGPDAKGVTVGQRFAVFPWIGCGACPACLRGTEHLCAKPRQLGCSSGVAGGYATHVLVPHPKYLLDYGKTEPALAATYMCSGVTAYTALKKVGALGPQDPLLILGVGGVGMMGVQFAQAVTGVRPLAADIDEGRLSAARSAGATASYNSREADAADRIKADTGDGVAVVVDFVGSEASLAFATKVIRRGGRVVIVGLFGGAFSAPIPSFPMRQMALIGSYTGSLSEGEEMMALVRAGSIRPIPIEKRPLAAASRTLDDLRAGRVTGRVVLTP
ncbi:MAG: alcohol dehydrogenase catalytic domain-containing protein [Alphaproteobacteria bacterium]|nr:alcohol dehydrogenase catalytic domain-containing protein [Alphaproteobacteria bacterium]